MADLPSSTTRLSGWLTARTVATLVTVLAFAWTTTGEPRARYAVALGAAVYVVSDAVVVLRTPGVPAPRKALLALTILLGAWLVYTAFGPR
jgi:hypothetical protein